MLLGCDAVVVAAAAVCDSTKARVITDSVNIALAAIA
jgi:hypothetical protein